MAREEVAEGDVQPNAPMTMASVTPATATEAAPSSGFVPDPRCRPNYPKKEGSCHFFMERKRRYCNIAKVDGSLYCGNHMPPEEQQCQQQAQEGREGEEEAHGNKKTKKQHDKTRVPCPIDPSHTVYLRNLKGHTRVCTRSREIASVASQPFYRLNVNSGPPAPPAPDSRSSRSSSSNAIAIDDIPSLFARVVALDRERHAQGPDDAAAGAGAVQQLTTGPIAAPIMALIEENGWASAKGRHAVQQASLVSHLHKRGLLGGGEGEDGSACCCVVELGAGRGSLGLAVKLAVPSAHLMLIERAGVRLKADKDLRRREGLGSFERHRVDIRHLYVPGLALPPTAKCLTFCGKHVCGVATDLSLRAVARYLEKEKEKEKEKAEAEQKKQKVGVIIACCCYHVCQYDDYAGRELWERELGLGRAEFEVLKRCACWPSTIYGERTKATASTGKGDGPVPLWGQDGRAVDGEEQQQQPPEHSLDDGEEAEHGRSYGKGMSDDEKMAVGLAAKRLINLGRLDFLRRACGMGAEEVVYCEPGVSPENTCLIGWT